MSGYDSDSTISSRSSTSIASSNLGHTQPPRQGDETPLRDEPQLLDGQGEAGPPREGEVLAQRREAPLVAPPAQEQQELDQVEGRVPPPPPQHHLRPANAEAQHQLVEDAQRRVLADAKRRARAALRQQLAVDHQTLHGLEIEEAEAKAEMEVDNALRKKEKYQTLLHVLRNHAELVRREAADVVTIAEDLVAANKAVRAGVPSPDPDAVRKARNLQVEGLSASKTLDHLEKSAARKEERAVAAYYRKTSEEQAVEALRAVRKVAKHAAARYEVASQELEDLLTPASRSAAPQIAVPDAAATAAAVAAAAAAAKPKMFARDFPVNTYVTGPFSGESPEALSLFATWRLQWKHAVKRINEMCQEVDEAALLHLLQATLTGLAAKVASTALTVNAAVAALEDKFGDVVALVESYLPPPAPPGETRCGTADTAAAKRYAQRWPRIDLQLEAHGIELKVFCGIRVQLAAFGGSAASKWRSHVKAELRRKQDTATNLGSVYNWTVFSQWLDSKNDEAEEAENGDAASSSAGIFSVSVGQSEAAPTPAPGCILCGASSAHRSAACSKLGDLSNEAFFEKCITKNWCKRCVQSPWSPAHSRACKVVCGNCGRNHVTVRHRHAVAAASERAKKRDSSAGQKRDGNGPKRQKAEPSREPAADKSALEKRLEKLEKAAAKPRQQQFKKDRRNRYHGKGGANKEPKGEPEK